MSIIQILSDFGISYRTPPHKNVRQGWCGVDCPRCSPNSQKFRLGFHLHQSRSHCWVCGSFYTPEILAEVLRISQGQAYEILSNSIGFVEQRPERAERSILHIPDGIGDFLPIHEHYLKSRRFNPQEISRLWGVKGIGQASRLQWRLFIPIADRFGKVVSWTTRTIGKENELRYVSASAGEEEISHKTLLYGAHLARHTIVVVEGPLDAWAVGPGGVATCGVGFSSEQKVAMAEYPTRVVCFDAENAAQVRAEALCRDLSAMPGRTENVMFETGKDASRADLEELMELRVRYFPEIWKK